MTPMTLSESSEEGGEQLIPRLPDEITLDKIAPKLSWIDFRSLALVSRAWLHAIRSHQVYEARVRAHSTETFVMIRFSPCLSRDAIALYSMRENIYYELAPVPQCGRGIPSISKFVSSKGKVFTVGGRCLCQQVQVLDLAGQRGWRQCASMLEPKLVFGFGSDADGKIYVMGGMCNAKLVCGSEVYDPKEDTWSRMKPMPSLRTHQFVSLVREELFVHGGRIYRPSFNILLERYLRDPDYQADNPGDVTKDANLSEIYNPVTDEWRTLQPFRPTGQREREVVFVAKGKLYCMTHQSIDVYDMDTNSWTQLHSNSFDEFGPVDSLVVVPLAVVAVDDELLAIVVFTDRDEEHIETSLVRSRGLRSDIKETVWRKAQPSLSFPQLGPVGLVLPSPSLYYMCTVQL
ncbi:unnamed protein product [Calypogeia fissa]